MSYYRLYLLNADRRIAGAVELDAEADEQALAHARMFEHPGEIEIWQEKRRVGTVEPSFPFVCRDFRAGR